MNFCIPDQVNTAVVVIQSPALEKALKTKDELYEAHLEYDRANRVYLELTEGVSNVIVGDYLIRGEWGITNGRAAVPPGKKWNREIIPLIGKAKLEEV